MTGQKQRTSESMLLSVRHFAELAFGIFIISSSGTLGRYITLPAPVSIWMRCLIGGITLYIVLKISRTQLNIHRKNYLLVFWGAILLGLHWVSYFYALQLSTVALGMLSLFTYPLITALLEPLILKVPFNKRHLPMTIIALIGVFLLIPEFSFENNHTVGILFGFASAIFYSVRNILLKKKISAIGGTQLMYYQLLIIAVLLWPVFFLYPIDLKQDIVLNNWQPLLILGMVTTAVGHTLFVRSLANFSVTTVSILSNLTPLFGIILGFLILHEQPKGNAIAGGLIILIVTIVEGTLSIKNIEVK